MILGSFYFRCADNGNLIGEFINQLSDRAATESADFIREDNGDLIYQSTWFDGETRTMRLLISRKQETINIFRFTWSDNITNHFFGEAFLSDGMFIGVYWDGYLGNKLENLLARN